MIESSKIGQLRDEIDRKFQAMLEPECGIDLPLAFESPKESSASPLSLQQTPFSVRDENRPLASTFDLRPAPVSPRRWKQLYGCSGFFPDHN